MLQQVEGHLKIGQPGEKGTESFRNEIVYSNEVLHEKLKAMIETIHVVQKMTISSRNSLYSSELNKLNCNKKMDLQEQKTITEVTAANSKLA